MKGYKGSIIENIRIVVTDHDSALGNTSHYVENLSKWHNAFSWLYSLS